MGREVKRTPVGWDWPVGMLWEGYVNPHRTPCPGCVRTDGGGGGGWSPLWQGIEGEVWVLFFRLRELAKANVKAAAMLDGLAWDDARGDCSHYRMMHAIGEAAGMPEKWGTCDTCHGSGVAPECQAAYDAWQRSDPPAGDGWSLWSTTSDGHPMTPSFATPEELAAYCATNRVSTFGRETADQQTWFAFITGPGWSPSAVAVGGAVVSGVEAVGG